MPRIAIVEDEAIVALDISRTLERRGHDVIGIFDSGEDLLVHIEAEKPDLILMDVHIRGDLDGIETSSIVRERYGIPVILLTAHAEADTVARATRSEPYAYILKPFEERELSAAIEVALYRARMEALTRASEEKYRRLFVDGLTAHFVCSMEGEILEANQAFKTLTGMSEETAGVNLPSLFADPLDWPRLHGSLGQTGMFPQTELRIRDVNNSFHTVLARAVRISGKDDSGLVQGELIDLTERRRLEDSLIQAQKMDAVGKLAGGVAHDFNNILTAIIGYADMLASETELDKTATEDLRGIRTTALKAVGLTRQLLAFSRKQGSTPSVFNLNTLVRDSEKMLRRLLPPGISLKLQAYSANPEVFADPGQVEQALLNLVVNARDAMPDGGAITVRTSAEAFGIQIDKGRGQVLKPGGYAILSVADSGPGIPTKDRETIFAPFFTTKPEGKGTGLGLSIVDSVVQRAHGATTIDTADPITGLGALFSLWLPLAPDSEKASLVNQESSIPVTGRNSSACASVQMLAGQKILVVDDDEVIVDLICRMLDRAGFSTTGASNAGEAVLITESAPGLYGLVIADIVMPHIAGDALCRRLSGMIPGLRCILMSGHPEKIPDCGNQKNPEAVCHGSASGNETDVGTVQNPQLFLIKPFTERKLLDTVFKAIESQVSLPDESTSR